ncbi:hypothetical protein GGR52DRAFT_537118 [Hypoxylon sp. FL1284]|nr:hypothetical protein GGR52DRAFT_537118 [Hypoxylon sp. FL1284]
MADTPSTTREEPPAVAPRVSEDSFVSVPTPPGLARATLPGPTDNSIQGTGRNVNSRVLTEQDVPMFHMMEKYFWGYDENGSHVLLDLTCPICLFRKLDVPAPVTPRQTHEEYQEAEPFTVLPCGHYFGSWCLHNWFVARQKRGLKPECAYCRFPLTHECGHNIRLRPYDPRFLRAGQTPLTNTEDGGVLFRDCAICFRNDLEHVATLLVYRVYPDIPQNAFMGTPAVSSREQFESLRNRMWDDIIKAHIWSQQRYDRW